MLFVGCTGYSTTRNVSAFIAKGEAVLCFKKICYLSLSSASSVVSTLEGICNVVATTHHRKSMTFSEFKRLHPKEMLAVLRRQV